MLLGIYTAAGDSQTPFKYNLVQNDSQCHFLDPVLIFGLLGSPALGSDGAGYATLFSQMVVSLLYACGCIGTGISFEREVSEAATG